MHYNSKINFLDNMKHLRELVNEGKESLYLCMHVWLWLVLIYHYFVCYNFANNYFL